MIDRFFLAYLVTRLPVPAIRNRPIQLQRRYALSMAGANACGRITPDVLKVLLQQRQEGPAAGFRLLCNRLSFVQNREARKVLT